MISGVRPEVLPCRLILPRVRTVFTLSTRMPSSLKINSSACLISALLAVTEALNRLPHVNRTVVYTGAGDRRDCDLVRQGRILGDAFQRVILHEDHYKRGRSDGEIIALLKQGLLQGSRVEEIQQAAGAIAAVELALKTLRSGDLLLIQADTIDETCDYLRAYLKSLVDEKTPLVAPPVGDGVRAVGTLPKLVEIGRAHV